MQSLHHLTVSLVHCKVIVEEETGEAWLEVLGRGTQLNDNPVDEGSERIKLEHKDVMLVGGRRLRFEYLPPDFKPIPSNNSSANGDETKEEEQEEARLEAEEQPLKAEVVDTEEELCAVEPEEPPATPATNGTAPGNKRVSFGPYLSPEQFDLNLPPATPVRKGATPRRSMRYSGLKFSRPAIEPLSEEDAAPGASESTVAHVDETVIDDENGKTLIHHHQQLNFIFL